MKTQMIRVWALGAALSGLVICAGCAEEKAQAEGAPTPEVGPAKPDPAAKLEAPTATPEKPASPAEARVVQKPVLPDSLKLSPGLAEIVKLAQAGVSEAVLLAYITNSTSLYHVGADEILYLNDLGVSTTVITTLIQRDAAPDGIARNPVTAHVQPPAPNAAPAIAPATVSTSPPAVAPAVQPVQQPAPPPQQPESVSYFYDHLAPYGSWVEVEGYGRCWQPTVAVANSYWRPYGDRGRWLWSDAGWYWYSDYSWGWAPFHYGRWHSAPRVGWVWVPDTCWGPAWVSWRSTSSHYGWAPLPPEARYVSGVGFSFHNRSVSIGFDFGLSSAAYSFVSFGSFCDRDVYRHRVASTHATALHRDSQVVNNYTVVNNTTVINHGVGRDHVTRMGGRPVPTATIRDGALEKERNTRPERLETTGSSLAVTRPVLPTPARSPQSHSMPSKPAGNPAFSAANSSAAPTAPLAPIAPIAPLAPTAPAASRHLPRPGTPGVATASSTAQPFARSAAPSRSDFRVGGNSVAPAPALEKTPVPGASADGEGRQLARPTPIPTALVPNVPRQNYSTGRPVQPGAYPARPNVTETRSPSAPSTPATIPTAPSAPRSQPGTATVSPSIAPAPAISPLRAPQPVRPATPPSNVRTESPRTLTEPFRAPAATRSAVPSFSPPASVAPAYTPRPHSEARQLNPARSPSQPARAEVAPAPTPAAPRAPAAKNKSDH